MKKCQESAGKLPQFSRMRILSCLKQLEEKFYVECLTKGCRFISLSITDLMDHEASCDAKDDQKLVFCKYCPHGLSDEDSLGNHLIFNHPYVPEVENGRVQYFCLTRKEKQARLRSPDFWLREEYTWRVLLESKGYITCHVPSCRYVTSLLPEMRSHYLDCSPKLWKNMEFICDECGGRKSSEEDLKVHMSECHRLKFPSFNKAEPELTTFWKLSIKEFGLSKCPTFNCKFVARSVNELDKHFRYCRVPRVENYNECSYCGGWLETILDLEVHVGIFHPNKNPGKAEVLMRMNIHSPYFTWPEPGVECSIQSLFSQDPCSRILEETPTVNVHHQEKEGIGGIKQRLNKILNPDTTVLGEMARIIGQEWKGNDHPVEALVHSNETSWAVKVPNFVLASNVVNRRMPSSTLKKVSKQTLEDNLNMLELSQVCSKIECTSKCNRIPKPLSFVQENPAMFEKLRTLIIPPSGPDVTSGHEGKKTLHPKHKGVSPRKKKDSTTILNGMRPELMDYQIYNYGDGPVSENSHSDIVVEQVAVSRKVGKSLKRNCNSTLSQSSVSGLARPNAKDSLPTGSKSLKRKREIKTLKPAISSSKNTIRRPVPKRPVLPPSSSAVPSTKKKRNVKCQAQEIKVKPNSCFYEENPNAWLRNVPISKIVSYKPSGKTRVNPNSHELSRSNSYHWTGEEGLTNSCGGKPLPSFWESFSDRQNYSNYMLDGPSPVIDTSVFTVHKPVRTYGRRQELASSGLFVDLEDLIGTNDEDEITPEFILTEWNEYCALSNSIGVQVKDEPLVLLHSSEKSCKIPSDLILETTIFEGYYNTLFPWEVVRRKLKKDADKIKNNPHRLSELDKNQSLLYRLLGGNSVGDKHDVSSTNREKCLDSKSKTFPNNNHTFEVHCNGESRMLTLQEIIYNDVDRKFKNDQIVYVVEKIVLDNPSKAKAALSAAKTRATRRNISSSSNSRSDVSLDKQRSSNSETVSAHSMKKEPVDVQSVCQEEVEVQNEPTVDSKKPEVIGKNAKSLCSADSVVEKNFKIPSKRSLPRSSLSNDTTEKEIEPKKKKRKQNPQGHDDKVEETISEPIESKKGVRKATKIKQEIAENADVEGESTSAKASQPIRKRPSTPIKNSNPELQPVADCSTNPGDDADSTRFLYIPGDAEMELAKCNALKKKGGRPAKKKRDKHGKFLVKATSSSVDDSLFLYIGKDAEKAREQNDTNECEPTGGKKLIPAENRIMYNSIDFDPNRQVKCAICSDVMTAHVYKSQHLTRHNHLCWLEGEEPMDFTDEKALERLLFNVYVNKKVPFKCEMCGVMKKSAKGFLCHRKFCGKSALERQNLKTPCSFCGRMLLPYSYRQHMSTFHSESKLEPATKSEPEEPLRPRTAATKCVDNINQNARVINDPNEFIDDDEEYKAVSSNDWIRLSYSVGQRRFTKDLKDIMEEKYSSEGLARCLIPGCDFTDSDVNNVVTHYRLCDKQPLEYKCNECNFVSTFESHVINHVRMTHFEKSNVQANRLSNVSDSSNNSANPAFIPFVRSAEQCSRSNIYLESCVCWTREQRNEFLEKGIAFPHWEAGDNSLFTDLDSFHDYLNLRDESMRLTFNSSEWFTLQKLSSRPFANDDSGTVLYTGGIVRTLDWFPSNSQQYLAISVSSVESVKKTDMTVDCSPGHVQIWSGGDMNNFCDTYKPPLVFEYAICHELGETWDLVCCPGGEPSPDRLGLVALATSSGKVAVFAAPTPDESIRGKACQLKPALMLELGTDDSFQVTKISWSKVKPHKFIAAGFLNGLIAIWDLTSTSSLLRLNDSLLPFKLFNPHLISISALSFCPVSDQYLLTACAEKSFKIWNLQDTSVPHNEYTRGLITDAAWLQYWMGTISCYDDTYTTSLTTACVNTVRNLVYQIQPLVTQTDSTALSISVNDWLNAFIVGYDSGQVVLSFARKQVHHSTDARRRIFNSLLSPQFHPFNPDSNEVPLSNSYEQTCNDFGIIFNHSLQVQNTFKVKPHKYTDLTAFPSLAANKVCWNPNEKSYLTFATGYYSGFVLISRMKLPKPEQKDLMAAMDQMKDM